MKISVIGQQYPDSLARNVACTLEGMGHAVQRVRHDAMYGPFGAHDRFRVLRRLIELHPRTQAIRDRRVVAAIAAFRPEVVINTYANWHPDAVARARAGLAKNGKILFLYPDPIAHLVREYALAAGYDALFFKDPHAADMFRSRLGLPAHYLPEACNPAWHRPVDLTEEDHRRYGCDITTAGALYYYRALQMEPLLGHDVKIWGTTAPNWVSSPVRTRYVGHYVAELEKSRAFRAAKIVLNTHTAKEFAGTNARTFEAAGCGAFQIADYRPALEELFEIDSEIVTYRCRDELREKVEYYLANDSRRRKIAEAGYRRAHTDHTYERRLESMLAIALGKTP